jgi:hypothetical protein
MKDLHHKRLERWEAFDKIVMEIVPRYKMSGLSGDEWRQSVHVAFLFKGEVVHTFTVRDMQTAILFLGEKWMTAQEPIPDRVIAIEKDMCDQPSCLKPASITYRIKQEFSDRGEKLDKDDCFGVHYRRFCEDHITRGDCSREDSDGNYEVIRVPNASPRDIDAVAHRDK